MIRYSLLLIFGICLFADEVAELKREVCLNLEEIPGWCSCEKASHFIDLVLDVKPQVCVEIGVFSGASLYPVAAALKYLQQGMMIAIDPWDKIECIRYLDPDKNRTDLKWWAHQNMDHVYFGFAQILKHFDLDDICIVFRCTSKKAAPAIGPIDILYIDGNHYEKIAREDVELYLPKVKKGGYIWFNDAKWPSVQPAIELLSEACDLIKTVDQGNCVLFRKKI
jgi:hypothetical protein